MGFFDFFKKKKTEEVIETITLSTQEILDVQENQTQAQENKKENFPEIMVSENVENVHQEEAQLLMELSTAMGTFLDEGAVEQPITSDSTKMEIATETTDCIVEEKEQVVAKTIQSGAEVFPAQAEISIDAPKMEAEQSGTVEEKTQVANERQESEAVEVPVKKGFFRKLVEGLAKTRNHVMQGVNDVLNSFTSIDEDFYEELEEALIVGDLGVNTAIKIVAGLKEKVKERRIKDPQAVKALLKEELKEQMQTMPDAYDFIQKKTVLLVIGVNGVGKTTTIGKLASQYKKEGKKVMLAAADTFRAAAIDQLKEWANRSDVPIVAQAENSDPGAVVYDAIASAKSKAVDILICDTAGRLHNKKNLMNELGKIYRIIGREYPEAHLEVFLVLDSTTGQNALVQAKEFKEMADITGIVLTKLDGTSKGGIAIAISADLKLPVKYIGVGEGIDDLRPFDANSFIEALFEE